MSEIKNNTELTENQIHHIYNSLSNIDKDSIDNIEKAKKETEASEYSSGDNNIIESNNIIPGVKTEEDIDNIHETDEDLNDVFKTYGATTKEAEQLLKLIKEYKNNKKINNIYNKMPSTFKRMVDGIIRNTFNNIDMKQISSIRNHVSKELFDEFINDAKISKSISDYKNDIATIMNEYDNEYNNIISDAFNDIFSKIDEIEIKNPEYANNIKNIKKAFDESITFNRQIEYIKSISPQKIRKLTKHFDQNIYYFNTTVNTNKFNIRFNNISDLIPIIKKYLSYDENIINIFIASIIKTIGDIDDLSNIAYLYKTISNIYKYNFIELDDDGRTIFNNISNVINIIIDKLNSIKED